MKNNNSRRQALDFSNELIDWFWQYGVLRRNEYGLSSARWLQPLYEARNCLKMVAQESNPRPANAIWGPSQTGKSTLVARYLDGQVKHPKGEGTALHWPDGEGAFFSIPRGQDPDSFDQKTIVLNPYNGGMDASACITRFTKGSLTGEEGAAFVRNPRFPVTLKFSSKKEVMLSVARGYDGQCELLRPDRFWNLTELQKLAQRTASASRDSSKGINKKAFEEAIALCDVLEDLAISGLTRFRGLLSKDGKSNEMRDIILQSTGLLEELKCMERFRDEILWDKSSILSQFYNRLSVYGDKLSEKWKGENLFCSLEGTACFLDMDSYSMFSKSIPGHAKEGSKDVRVHRALSALEYSQDENGVYLGVGSSQGLRLFENPCEFGIFQCLIQEVIIPLNMQNLEDTPFRSFVDKYDLLDFPGVERGGQSSSASKLVVDEKNNESMDSVFPWDDLFCKVLKRGKTSSLFQGYAKRMLLDAVSIFQDLDNDKPNGQDLITGVETWWKSTDSGRSPESREQSPLPLNCVLTWWAKMLNESPANTATIFGKNRAKYEQLGPLSDPKIANLIAINDFTLPRGKLNKDTMEILPTLLDTIQGEPEFKKLFSGHRASPSLETSMKAVDGGMDAFFALLLTQVDSSSMRNSFWETKANEAAVVLEKLLSSKGLMPQGKSREKERVKNLEVFKEILASRLKPNDLESRKDTEEALKFLLNVNAQDLESLPLKNENLNTAYLRRQFHLEGEKLFSARAPGNQVCWKQLGFSTEDQAQLSWQAICVSIEPSLKEILDWLHTMVVQRNKFKNFDFRKFLAVKMANQFIPPSSLEDADLVQKELTDPDSFENSIIKASENRFSELMKVKVKHLDRDEQAGDDEIRTLCDSLYERNTENQ